MSNTTKIARKIAIAVFVELGFKSATGWDDAKLNGKLAKLADHVDGTEELDSAEAKAGLKDILAGLKDGGTVVVADETDASAKPKGKAEKPAAEKPKAEEKPAKAKPAAKEAPKPAEDEKPAAKGKAEAPKGKAKAEEKPAKKPAPAKKKADDDDDEGSPGAAKDRFGNREGSGVAKINALITKSYITLDEVVEKTEVRKGRARRHLRKLVKKGFVEKVDGKGYRLASAGK